MPYPLLDSHAAFEALSEEGALAFEASNRYKQTHLFWGIDSTPNFQSIQQISLVLIPETYHKLHLI